MTMNPPAQHAPSEGLGATPSSAPKQSGSPTAEELLGNLPGSLSSRYAKGDVMWAQWHPGRQVDLIRQIADEGGMLGDGCHRAWKPRVERLMLAVATLPGLMYGTGLLKLMLAERSFKARAEPNEIARLNPKTSRRDYGSRDKNGNRKKIAGPLALRSGLSAPRVYTLNQKREELGLLKITRSYNRQKKRQGANNYDMPDDLLDDLRRHIRSGVFRLAAEIHVAEFVLRKFQRVTGYAEFARNELSNCGLVSQEWAEAALDTLIRHGVFYVIGFGQVTLPEFVHAKRFKLRESWELWVPPKPDQIALRNDNPVLAPEMQPSRSSNNTQTLRNDNPVPLLNDNPGVLRNENPDVAPEWQPVELQEVGPEQQEAFEPLEEPCEHQEELEQPERLNSSYSSTISSHIQSKESELLSPDFGSGTPSPSPGSEMGRDPEGRLVILVSASVAKTPPEQVEHWRREVAAAGDDYDEAVRRLRVLVPLANLVDRVGDAIGPAMPEQRRRHREAITSFTLHKLRKALLRGGDDNWLVDAVSEIGDTARLEGRPLPDWKIVAKHLDIALEKLGGGSQ